MTNQHQRSEQRSQRRRGCEHERLVAELGAPNGQELRAAEAQTSGTKVEVEGNLSNASVPCKAV